MPLLPPAHFDHPYPGHVIESVMPWAKVNALCYTMSGYTLHVQVDGCSAIGTNTKTGEKVCMIVITKGPNENTLRRHEVAHCNGWNATHSN